MSSKESESAAESARALDESFKENEYAAESARVLDEALDRMTSDKQKQAPAEGSHKFSEPYTCSNRKCCAVDSALPALF